VIQPRKRSYLWLPALAWGLWLHFDACTAQIADTNLSSQIDLLRQQNELLQKQVQTQNGTLDRLAAKVDRLESQLKDRDLAAGDNAPTPKIGLNFGKVNLSAEGGVAFFHTGSDGFAPSSDFRVDEARLFLEAPVWNEVYFFGDVDLADRANDSLNTQLGELYLDAQDVSQLWGRDRQLNVRAGRMQIPFGEEYLNRYAMENPLISRSISDIWGIDPGIEIYGAFGKFSYAVAVQNGGVNGVQDFDNDKSIAGRLSYDPNAHWHFSVSGMRTGNLNVQQDMLSALWFGGAFFRSIGSPATTRFHADLVEADATFRWHSGHLTAFGGYARYDDNDPAAANGRDLFYYSLEAVQNLPGKFFVATRFSQVFANGGYPIAGFGNFGSYFFSDLTDQLWRLSLGGGYRFSDHFELKIEYAFERGPESDGESRNREDFLGTEAAFKF
jgi:hypothetical protein